MSQRLKGIRQVVIWGYPKDSHTHSYIHEGYYRAFISMGYATYWFNNNDAIRNFDFSDTLFVTSGDVESKLIPIRKDCLYITHNCPGELFSDVRDRVVNTQVLTKDVPNLIGINKINSYTFFDGYTLYQPWATNLLPDEIQLEVVKRPTELVVNYVGTVDNKGYSNVFSVLNGFAEGCKEDGIRVLVYGGYTPGGSSGNILNVPGFINNDRHIELIKKSVYAPQICGDFQLDIGYIPCRIFKNISYGHHGITNSKYVNEFFDGQLIYDEDGYSLYKKAKVALPHADTLNLIKLVRDKHTYLNRIDAILEFFK